MPLTHRRIVFLFAAVVLGLVASACGKSGNTHQSALPVARAAVYVAGDTTLIGGGWQEGAVGADYKDVVRWCAEQGCKLTLGRVSESSATGGQEVVDFAMPEEAKGDPDAQDALKIVLRNQAVTVADRFFAAKDAGACTDLVGAITNGAAPLKAGKPHARRMVLFSGAFQTCPPNLLTAEATDAGALRLIEQLRADRLLPDLSGVDVWLVGAGRVRPGEVLPPPERVTWVKRFWDLYFEKTGAHLVASGTRLENYSD